MKVIFFHNQYQHKGGEDSVVANEIRLLEDHGHLVDAAIISNDEIKSVKDKLYAAMNVAYSKQSYDWCCERLERFRPDIAHVHNIFPLITTAVYDACRDNNVPVVQTFHNYRIYCANGLLLRDGKICEDCLQSGSALPAVIHGCYRGSRIASFFVARMINTNRKNKTWERKINRVIVASNYTREKLLEGGIPFKNICLKPHLAFPKYAPIVKVDPDKLYALCISRLSHEKGIETLLESWKQQDIELRIVGGGPERERYERLASDKVRFLGRLDDKELAYQLSNAAFMVMPSECYENFPVVVAEAYSYGVPVVASNIGSLKELVLHDETGLLFQAGNPDNLKSMIDQLKNDDAKLGIYRKNAFYYYKTKLSPEVIYSRVMEIYKDAMN